MFGGAISAVRSAESGMKGYALAIIIGLALVACNVFMFNKLGEFLADRTSIYTETQQDWIGFAFCIFALLWMIVAAIVGGGITSTILRLVL